jgi:hypothetical protein
VNSPAGHVWMQYVILAAGLSLFAQIPANSQGYAENPAYRNFRDPLQIRNMRPYQTVFLQFMPESPRTLRPGLNRFNLQLDVANNMLAPAPGGGPIVAEDNEEQRVLLSWRYGVRFAGGSEVGVFVPVKWRNGGFLDEILRVWHRILGTSVSNKDNPAGRESFPNYQSVLRVTDGSGNNLVNAGSAFGVGDLSVTLKKEITRRAKSSKFALRIGLKLPTGDPGEVLGSGGVDVGLCLDGQIRMGNEFMLFSSVGGAWTGRVTRLPNVRSWIPQGMLALEYRPNNRDSWIWQLEGSAAAVSTGNRFADGPQVTGSFGYKRVLNRHLVLDASFSENGDINNYAAQLFGNVGPDFTATLGLEWHP